MNRIAALICGFIFAIGLGVSGMLKPEKVVGFLDLFGHWDPSLAMVMVGAIGVHGLAYAFIKKMPKPKFADQFHLPTSVNIDSKLILGSVLFGAGWGLSGFCPGPALVSLTSGAVEALIFGGAMFVGFGLFSAYDATIQSKTGE